VRHTYDFSLYAEGMKLMRSTWTDSRLDDLNQRVGEMSHRLDGLQHTMVHGFLALVVIMVSGFMGLAGLIVTKL
jgi:hypothetical protein